METVAGCWLSWVAFRGRLQIRVSPELQFPEDILSAPKPGTEARWLHYIFQKASSSRRSDDDDGGRDEGSWSRVPRVDMGRGRSCRRRAASRPAQPLLGQSSGQGRGESIVGSLSEGTASPYTELQNPKPKRGV